ncbi:MAG: zinc-ribbon domain-containing protein [Treponema sp.]|jgi:hypothetical protein|nr:zinc-ribbon domain-containing protein [Treponema sp.]
MNANLLAVVKRIVAEKGEGILSNPRLVSAFFADLAKDEPKPQKNAFIKCLEQGFAQTIKNVPEQDRALCIQRLSQRLNEEEGLDPRLCGEALELLAAVLFGEEQKKEKNVCKNCGKELQEGWKTCPYCTTVVAETAKTSQVISSAISSGSGSWGYGIGQIKPVTPRVDDDDDDVVDTETVKPETAKLTGGQIFVVILVSIPGGILSYFALYALFYLGIFSGLLLDVVNYFFPSVIEIIDAVVKVIVQIGSAILAFFLIFAYWGLTSEQFEKINAKKKQYP